ncbi:hypothetical protein GEMRC1_009604 [Eukaryota sp. GEM-RC1]
MENLGNSLMVPTEHFYKHNLLTELDSAIRSSNAINDDAIILNCLDIKPLTDDVPGGQRFTLDYNIEPLSPVNLVLPQHIINRYLDTFYFIWKIKRCESVLANVWMGSVPLRKQDLPNVAFSVLHLSFLMRLEMENFVATLQHHVYFEVLERNWSVFSEKLKNAQSIDDVISAHEELTVNLITRTFLDPDVASLEVKSILMQLFEIIYQFEKLHVQYSEDLSFSLANYRDVVANIDLWNMEGEFGGDVAGLESKKIKIFTEICEKSGVAQNLLNEHSRKFKILISQLISSMNKIRDQSLKFFTFKLDFNSYYRGSDELALEEEFSPITKDFLRFLIVLLI